MNEILRDTSNVLNNCDIRLQFREEKFLALIVINKKGIVYENIYIAIDITRCSINVLDIQKSKCE